MVDLEKRLDIVCESLASSEEEFNTATTCLIGALQGIHDRLENIELWIDKERHQKESP